MILLGLGGNLPSPRFGAPRATLQAALVALADLGIHIRRRSRWYRSAPVPESGQPWYTNGVAQIETDASPADLLTRLLATERRLGRRQHERWTPRVVDLDLLAYGRYSTWSVVAPADTPILPHPRLHERAFVLLPLAEIAPGWRHPALDRSVEELLAALPAGQVVEPLEDGPVADQRRTR